LDSISKFYVEEATAKSKSSSACTRSWTRLASQNVSSDFAFQTL